MSVDARSDILARALELFACRGYDGVGVQEIVEAAGVTKPTLYHYFGSKRGLLQALLAEPFALLDATVAEAAAYAHDLPMTLRRIASAYVRFASTNSTFYRMQLSMYFAPQESEAYAEVSERNMQQFRTVERMFQLASKDHGNMKGRHTLYAATFMGMINTSIGLSLNGQMKLSDELVHRIVHQFEHGIYS